MVYIVQASIGRNIGDEPMSDNDWTHFMNDVSNILRKSGETPEFHFGKGVWEGISEDSVRITVYRDEITPLYRHLLATSLPRIAARYGQDAIGLIVSESILITR